ncbi:MULTISPECIES: hypothetical protein [Streptomyces]|uniref:hypothetical protein n=1 Tax=Streptomyces TaxID=1883 RepID=UPI00163D02A0|nr:MULTISPECIES: hypothetical protein [Streptomyces]MBC2875350.1 hypothetical protein [Streptomyces sp. TYQ1024]UBI37166.1 hypothetical protein K7I03_12305 [Streptomyces mobaraensis]UKW29760.1 hypothetical protein MCU78_12280 [Streptomyces sp. TYQ1024]
MRTAVTFEELAGLHGEELPPRTVLSSLPAGNGDPSLYPMLVRSEHGTTVVYACQYRQDAGSSGLLAALGLAPSTPGHTITCIPAGISTH